MTAAASEAGLRGAGGPPRDPRIPRPPKRVPLLGDILTFRGDEPTGSAIDYAAALGPIFEFAFMGARYVVAAGADIVEDLNDEKRFCKHLGPELVALRILGGDGLFTRLQR